jgi:cytochrome c55X
MRDMDNGVAGQLLLVVAALVAAAALAGDSPDPARRAQLVNLVRQDCGSCHGMTLKGGLGPALTREALHGRPAPSLVATVLYGRPGTPMPPWREFVTGAEADWIVRQLQQGTLDER